MVESKDGNGLLIPVDFGLTDKKPLIKPKIPWYGIEQGTQGCPPLLLEWCNYYLESAVDSFREYQKSVTDKGETTQLIVFPKIPTLSGLRLMLGVGVATMES